MATLAFLLQTAVVTRALFLVPFEGGRRYAALAAAVRVDPAARTRFFLRFLAQWWLTAAVVLASLALASEPLSSLKLAAAHGFAPWGLLGAWILALGFPLLRLDSGDFRAALAAQLAKVPAILPGTRRERLLFAAVSVTAGICEELVFRGLVPAWSTKLLPALQWLPAVLSIAGFGLAHAYQGLRGVVLTALLGALLYAAMALTGSLCVPMAMHALNDLRFLALVVALDRPLVNRPRDLP